MPMSWKSQNIAEYKNRMTELVHSPPPPHGKGVPEFSLEAKRSEMEAKKNEAKYRKKVFVLLHFAKNRKQFLMQKRTLYEAKK
jgi:pyruvate/2-oxoacid:ferredoxin oxidoreductase alpha subunit